MSSAQAAFRTAEPNDSDAVLHLMSAYYAEDGYRFAAEQAAENLARFIEHPEYGSLWVAVADGQVIGYLVVTLGFSFEYGGRDAFIDELYISDAFRALGLGGLAMDTAEAYCRRLGVRAMHLEVEPHRTRAASLYARRGFRDTGRKLMSKRLSFNREPED